MKVPAGKGAGKQFKLRDWQKDFIRAVYATDGEQRVVRTAFLTMGRKNGKTALAAGLSLAHLCGPMAEPRGEVYTAAVDRNQSSLLYKMMKAMVEEDAALSETVIIRDFNKSLEDTNTGSIYQALSADVRSKHGFGASCVVCDELAQWPSRDLYDVLETSTGGREAPLVVAISTLSPSPIGIMSELVRYGRQVNAGEVADPSFHLTEYTAPMDADIWEEATWYLANPALNDFRSIDEMRTYARQAKEIPAREPVFRNLYLNQPVESEARWLPPAVWTSCASDIDVETLKGERAFGGLDLGSTTDLTSLALWFPARRALLSWSWVPQERMAERERTDKVPYKTWCDAGLIEAVPGRAANRRWIGMRVAQICSQFEVVKIAFDRWRIDDLKSALSDEGIALPLEPFGQGFKDMSPAVESLESLVLNGELRHPDSPVLNWCVANVAMDTDPAGSRKPNKERSVERIDALAAAFMAVGVASREQAPKAYDFSRPIVLGA